MSYDDSRLQYISDAEGHPTAVIVPLEIWNDMAAERDDTEYLSASPAMLKRLEEARASKESIPAEDVFKMLDHQND